MDSQDRVISNNDSSPDATCPKCRLPRQTARAGSMTAWMIGGKSRLSCTCNSARIAGLDAASTLSPSGSLRRKLANLDHQRDQLSEETLSLVEVSDKMHTRLHLIEITGESDTGTVLLARANATSEMVAVKLLSTRQLLEAPDSIERFERQIAAVSKLNHPNLLRVRQHGVPIDGCPYIIMDYVNGVDLGKTLERSGPLSIEEAIDVFSQVAKALAYAHEQGVIHRDLKPTNILISMENEHNVKVADFGLAKVIRKTRDLAQKTEEGTGEIIGSPYYMSPEQCNGDSLDARSDIYSAGCVMYEAVAGHPPFGTRNPIKVILAHIKEKPRRISTSSRDSVAFESVVFKCLRKIPSAVINPPTNCSTISPRSNKGARRTQCSPLSLCSVTDMPNCFCR